MKQITENYPIVTQYTGTAKQKVLSQCDYTICLDNFIG